MCWLELLPITLAALVAIVQFATASLVELGERRRRRRHPARPRQKFRPRLIEGGKARGPAATEASTALERTEPTPGISKAGAERRVQS